MPTLAEIQSSLRDAVVLGETAGIKTALIAEKRLAIHQRNYAVSLVNALLSKFPATTWLVGTAFISEAATKFVLEQPPRAPCIAEYGDGFPRFLSECPAAEHMPYLGAFARLEWHVGQVSIAIDQPAVSIDEFSKIDTDRLPDTLLTLQDGVRYLHTTWPVDDLIKLYLTETAPEFFNLTETNIWIEMRGARGEFHINRLDAAEFMFRQSISKGRSIGDAAERALDTNTMFDPGQALAALVDAGLVTAFAQG